MIEAIAFDLDDTLFPEVDYVFSGYRAVAARVKEDLGFQVYDELVALYREGRHDRVFDQVLQDHLGRVEEEYVLKLVDTYRRHEPVLRPFPETIQVLDQLKSQYRLALISDGYLAVQERKLKALQLRDYFEVVIFSDRWGRDCWKPHSRPYEECARGLGLEPDTIVYVGDNPAKDFVTARAMGMPTVRVRRPNTLHFQVQHSAQYQSDYEVASLDELPPMLRLIAGQPAPAGDTGRPRSQR